MNPKMARWFLMLGAVAMALMFWGVAAHADTYTMGDMVLTKPAKSSLNWDGKINGNFDIIASSAVLKTSTQTLTAQITHTGQTIFNNKVGIFSTPNAAYGVTLATSAVISQPMTFSQSGPLINWANAGSSVTIQGIFTAGGKSGIEILDNAFSWNGRLDLGTLYGPQLYGKGAIANPHLGLNNDSPAYALDVTGDGHFTSSMTVDADSLFKAKLGVNNQVPFYSLDVSGTIRASAQAIILGTATVAGSDFSVGGSTLVVTAGNVGIGTTGPSTILHARNAADGVFLSLDGVAGAAYNPHAGIYFKDAYSSLPDYNVTKILSIQEGTGNYASLAFHTSNGAVPVERMRVNFDGNVGIGTSGPGAKLHVVPGQAIFSAAASAAAGDGWTYNGARGVYGTNYSGATLSSGTVLTFSANYAYEVGFTTNPANGASPIGTLMDDSCAAGAVCRVCTEGICPAKLDAGASCTTANTVVLTGAQGTAVCSNAPDATTTHWQEIGQPASFTSAATGSVIKIWAHRN